MTETIALPLWAVAAAAAVLALLAIVAVLRIGGRQAFALLAVAAVLVGAGWFVLDRLDSQSRAEQRRTIEARLATLQTHALRPNSNLACLDTTGGNVVYEACERVLFSSPEQISAALNYVGARLDLLREIAALPDREEAAYAGIRMPLMRSIEADRFGLVAQVLIARDGCRPNACYAFDLVQRRDQLVTNMTEGAYDVRVVRFAASWSEKPAGSGPALAASPASQPPAPTPSALNLNFPSASSIPPVSIMSNEPGMGAQNGVDATAKPAPAQPRRPAQKAQAPKREPQAAVPPPSAAPFPQPVGSALPAASPPVGSSAQQTTGAPPPTGQQ